MKFTTQPTTHRYRIGACPACRDYLWADVDVIAEVSEPTLTSEGKASVYASARCIAMRIEHECVEKFESPDGDQP